MALDASIYGNLLGRPVRSIADWEKVYQGQDDARLAQEDARQQRALNALALQLKQGELGQQQQTQAEQNALTNWLPTADQNAPDFAFQALKVAPRAAPTFLKNWGDQREAAAKAAKEEKLGAKAAAETELEKLRTARERLSMIYNATSGAKDQASYTMALQGLAAQGIDVSKVPQQFDPAYVAQSLVQAKTAVERANQELKERELALKANNELIGLDGRVNQTLLGAKERIAGAGAARSTVSINTGQKGLDNEFKLRGEFKQEPVYKAHQEMQAAHGQIKQAIAQQSPAGDLAAATKIMKLLDPGSVVRESELGMAMQASGLMDRITNYGNMVITGQKLTPTQRKDFASLADRLMGESVKAYNGKRSEYQRLGGEYGLNADRALGPNAPDVPKANSDGWGIRPVTPKGQ